MINITRLIRGCFHNLAVSKAATRVYRQKVSGTGSLQKHHEKKLRVIAKTFSNDGFLSDRTFPLASRPK